VVVWLMGRSETAGINLSEVFSSLYSMVHWISSSCLNIS